MIVSRPAILDGTPVFAGTRIPASLVKDLYHKGYSVDLIATEYPSLSKPILPPLSMPKRKRCKLLLDEMLPPL